jgi:two-component system, cell cycle sensor histidine kinase and response regulator CckA
MKRKAPPSPRRPPVGQERALLATVIDAAPMGVLLVDATGNIVMANPEIERITGHPIPDVIGRPLDDLLPMRSRQVHKDHWALFAASPHARRMGRGRDLFALHQDGREIPVEIGLAPLEFEGERYVLASLIDITERKQAESARRADHELLRAVIEGATDPIFLKDREGRYVLVNSAEAHMVGRSATEMLGRDATAVFPADIVPVIRDADERVMAADQARTEEITVHGLPGGTRTFMVTRVPHHDAFGAVIGVIGMAKDVTEQRVLERQLRQAQKMEAVGRLAGGIAHDFNNLLTAIGGYADFLYDDLPPADPRRADAGEIRHAADRAATLTRQLLAFSRQQVLEPRILDLGDVVLGLDKLLRRLIGEDVLLETVLAPHLGRVRADPGQVEQVLVNLAVNSRDAMPAGGRLTIETADVELGETYVAGHDVVQPGRYIMLAVTDTGQGMNEEVKAHLFEPFFTTKEQGKGTGLGLATVYGIVKQSGGYIWAYSELGKGTVFKVYLPRVEAEPDAPAQALPPGNLTGTETILLVEDEEGVRKLAREVLQRHGYRVIEAARGDEALALLMREAPDAVHLLISDVVLAGMGGPELHQRVARVRPRVRVLFMSGYTDRAVQAQEAFAPGTAFLQKPFTPAVLARKVRQILDSAPRRDE